MRRFGFGFGGGSGALAGELSFSRKAIKALGAAATTLEKEVRCIVSQICAVAYHLATCSESQ